MEKLFEKSQNGLHTSQRQNLQSHDGIKNCPRCTCEKIILDDALGESICTNCGMVISEKIIDSSPEWRTFSGTENRSRVGSGTSLTMYDYGLTTTINPSNKDSVGKKLSLPMTQSFKRLRKWDKRSYTNKITERNFQEAFTILGIMKDKLALSDAVVEKAAYIYRKLVEKKLIRGRSIHGMMCASVYAACRDSETPRNLRDIVKASNLKRKELAASYRMIVRELELKMPVIDSKQCITRIANNAGMSEKIKRYAFDMLQKAENEGVVAGKDPVGMAASSLYLSAIACGENYSQKDIADAANTSEVTIRNRNKTLETIFGFSTKSDAF